MKGISRISRFRRWSHVLAPGLLSSVLACVSVARAGTLQPVASFGPNPGNLAMHTYVPAGAPASPPLVVVLHGCAQTADQYVREAGWYEIADRYKVALVAPEQSTANNSSRCFNWFESGDQSRGQGEAQSIASMVDFMITNRGIDTNRVYVTGLSAGGAMTAAMLATYPEKFEGGAIMAGIPYQCATSATEAFTCMKGVNKTPPAWGDRVRGATSHTGPWPLVSIWQGSSDTTVKSGNLTELMEQWTDVHGIDGTADATAKIGNATRSEYKDASGVTRVETFMVNRMGHAVAVDPGTGPGTGTAQCGVVGTYASDENVCSSYHAAARWGLTGD